MFLDLSRVKLLSLDTEATGLTYRDRPVGASITTEDGRHAYMRWGHRDGGNNCSLAQFRAWARRELLGKTVVMHNALYDLRMLAYERVDLSRSNVEDTGFIAALLNELEPSFELDELARKFTGSGKDDAALNEYCANRYGGRSTRKAQAKNYHRAPGDVVEPYALGDSDATLTLYRALRASIDAEDLADVYALETSLIPILLRMHLEGVPVNVAYAERLKKKLTRERDRLHKEWLKLCGGVDVNYRSGQQLAPLFARYGIKTPSTIDRKTGEPTGRPSFKKDYLEHIDHPVAQTKLKLAQLDHYVNTFIDSYVLSNVADDGRIHGEFHPLRNDSYGTVSGRFSSGGALNLQNIPARDEEWAPLIRGMYVPIGKDHRWLREDYSQIEFRYLAHYAGGALERAYNERPDIDFHQMVAELTGLPRKPAKNINFGLVYGMGVKLMAVKLGVSEIDARDMLGEYHERLPEVRQIYDRADRRAQRRGFIRTWGGRKRRFRRQGRRFMHTHKALNALLQGSAADLIKKAMVAVDQVIDWDETRMHLTVHDELDFSIPRGDEKRWVRCISEAMESFKIRVPIKVEAEVGEDWGHLKEVV